MSANLQLYKQEVINFLQSCTIIFSPLAAQMNATLQAQGIAVDPTQPETFKYYLNVSGQYHSADTMMTVQSLDTQQTVNFTVDMLAISPKTKSAYVIGSPYYTALCNAYPAQVDLIKSIIYPVDISAAIAAPDFSLLGWGDGILEANEQDSVIHELNATITYIAKRWYFSFLSYETYYTWAFWAVFWQSLPNAIFAARLKNLHTSSVHSFHIWSYLQSHGIGDYSDILTSQQALFLYRNLRYLEQNKGKQSNLVILVNNLLDTISVGLVGKTIYMNTATKAALCMWTPEFVSTIVPTLNSQSLEIVAPESFATLNTELISAGLEVDNSAAWIEREQTRLSHTSLNTIPTKLVEIEKIGIDQKYGGLLNNFILDTLVWAITSDYFTPAVVVTDPTTKIALSLNGKQALALYYYAVHRSCREQPIELPTIYLPTCAFRPGVTAASIPEIFAWNGFNYPTRSYLNIDLLDGLIYPNGPIAYPKDFSQIVADLFLVLIRYVRYSRVEGDKVSLEMLLSYCKNDILQTKPYGFSLSTVTDYATWATNTGAAVLFQQLDALTNYTDAYVALSNAITTALIPENGPIYQFFAYTNAETDSLYDRLRDLFVQLCSYNIAFLDTSRVNAWWVFTERLVYTIAGIDVQEMLANAPILCPGEIVQNDTLFLPWVTNNHEITVVPHSINPVYLSETTTFKVTLDETRPVFSPLPILSRESSITDTIYFANHLPLRTAVITDDTSNITDIT